MHDEPTQTSKPSKPLVRRHTDSDVYKMSFNVAMQIFRATQSFPKEEMYSLTDQIRRSSRSVCSNLTEAWRKRRYSAAFVAKLSDAESEAAETQTWIQFAVECGYWTKSQGREIYRMYDRILAMIIEMIRHSDRWILSS